MPVLSRNPRNYSRFTTIFILKKEQVLSSHLLKYSEQDTSAVGNEHTKSRTVYIFRTYLFDTVINTLQQ